MDSVRRFGCVAQQIGLEEIEHRVDAVEAPGQGEAEGLRVAKYARTSLKQAGLLPTKRWDVSGVGHLHQACNCVEHREQLQRRRRPQIRAAGKEDDAGEAERREGGIGEGRRKKDAELIIRAEDAILLDGRFAEMLQSLTPELEPAGDGDDLQGLGIGVGVNQADVVGDDAMAATLEAGGQGGFSCPRVTQEGGDGASTLDRAGVQGKHSVLVTQDAKDGAEQVSRDVGGWSIGCKLQTDFVSISDVVARGTRDVEQTFGGGNLAEIAIADGVAEGGGYGAETDGDCLLAWARGGTKLGYIDLRLEAEGPEVEDKARRRTMDFALADGHPQSGLR